MTSKQNILFKINYLKPSSIPIQIIDQVAVQLSDSVDIHVLVLFGRDGNQDLPIDGEYLNIVYCEYDHCRDVFRHMREALRWIRKLNPDIIHTNHLYSSWLLSYKRWSPATTFIHTIHSDYEYYQLRGKLDFFTAFTFYDWIIHNSENTKQSWPERYSWLGSPAEAVVYNGINCEQIDAARPSREMTDAFNIVSAGRFVNLKNFDLGVRAVAELVEQGYDDVKYILIGDGPRKDEYQRIIDKKSLESHISLPGFLPRHDVYEKMWAGDVFMVPSRTEGFCNAAVEGMFTDNVVVASDIEPLNSEVIGEHGVYFEAGNLDSLVGALTRLVTDFDSYTTHREKLRERARTEFSLETAADQHRQIYTQALGLEV